MAIKAPSTKQNQIVKHIPPHNLEAEGAVLGAILINPDSMNKVVEILETDYFYSPQNRLIYEAAFNLYNQNKPIDALSLAEYFSARNQLEDIGGVEYLGELGLDTVLSSNIEYYAEIIKENAIKRKLVTAGQVIIEETFKNPDANTSLEIAQKTLFEIAQQKSSQDVQLITNLLMETVEQLEYRYNNKGSYTGVPSGYYDLDAMLAGFQKSDLIILAARPSMGKTAFALNIAQNIGIEQKVPVLIFSLEMSATSLTQRILCSEAEIDAQRARTGELNAPEWEKIADVMNKLHEAPILIDDSSGVTLSDIRAKARRIKTKYPDLGIIIIDYLQLIEDKSTQDRFQAISSISRGLKSLARELSVPVIALSQLSRKVEERTSKVPMLSDLRESGAIEQDADVVMFVHREEYYDKENPELKNKAQIVIAKQRNGPVGSVDLLFFGAITKFKNKMKPVLES
ncbi:MAG: replicative DNA helicase [Candidatus Gastranaerophilales bacterium]|nr:replicative DNA helicase [Candidatus Gastranaerophilales bacterium]